MNIIQKIKRFQELSENVRRNIEEMAQIYHSLNGALEREKFIDANPNIPMGVWHTLELIAEKKIYYGILWTRFVTNSRLRLATVEIQEQIVERGVPLLVSDGSHINLRLCNATDEQFDQLFTQTGVLRDLPAQKALVESRAMRSQYGDKQNKKAYVIDGKTLIIKRATTIRLCELKKIVEVME